MLKKYFNEKYLNGDVLVGDDFQQSEIKQWYKEEEEAYCNLTSNSISKNYLYENVNNFYGLKKILSKINSEKEFNILCFGAAYGGEARAIKKILDQDSSIVYNITVIDSSDVMLQSIKEELGVSIIKASIDGSIDLDSNSFNLITSFGVLHHIPNVSYVLSEFNKVLKPKGFIFLREPISSMGDWSKLRVGTTINERGISSNYLAKTLDKLNCKVVSRNYCFFSPILKFFNKIKLNLDSHIVIYTDFIFSKLFSWNMHYYRNNVFKKFAPGSVFILCQKK